MKITFTMISTFFLTLAVHVEAQTMDEKVSDALVTLGIAYKRGQGELPQNYDEAIHSFRSASELGNADARFNLGIMYSEGEGVVQSYSEAAKWFRLAAGQGHDVAQFYMGIYYETGTGLPQNYTLAHMWYNIASANGISESGRQRDQLASLMPYIAISDAQAMAGKCIETNYQQCGP